MKYKVWILFSSSTKTCYISTHIKFESMTIKDFKLDIPKWERSDEMKDELNTMAKATDFDFKTDVATHVDDLHCIADAMRKKGYKVLNGCLVLKKSNELV